MATFVFFHAHPDDEVIATGGTMVQLSRAGHDVVLVTATAGEVGEVPDGFLDPGEELWQRRVRELEEAARILGVRHVELLGYRDSGMMGEPTNDDPACFWQADVEEAAERLAAILRAHGADVLVAYDERGNYGHPDHIQVHRVGVRAGELAGVEQVYEATMNRDHIARLMAELPDDLGADQGAPTPDEVMQLGTPEAAITTCVDVRDALGEKRRAMQAHASQIGDTSFFLAMDADQFEKAFGLEWYVRRGAEPRRPWETSLEPVGA